MSLQDRVREDIDRLLAAAGWTVADITQTGIRPVRDLDAHTFLLERADLPKTLVFAKDNNHAEGIVGILREAWGRGNEFAQRFTYRTTGRNRRGRSRPSEPGTTRASPSPRT